MFDRPDWQAPSDLNQPWRAWYHKIAEQKAEATPEELEAKPWLQVQDSTMPNDVVLDKPFYK
jgi:hypothetical protein